MEICLICNERDPIAKKYAQKIFKELKIKGFEVYKDITTDFLECNKVDLKDFNEFVITIGDSRTFLQNIGRLKNNTKILPISTEQKCFFSEIDIHNISFAIKNLKNNEFFLEKRTRLKTGDFPPSLNEISIFPKRSVTLMRYTLKIDGTIFYRTSADGVVISTPTGSTGYSLSLGGPIIKTDAEVFLINPVAPIGRKTYPLVVSDKSIIELEDVYSETPIEIVVDGYFRKEVSEEKIIIKKYGEIFFVRFDTKPVTEKIEERKDVLELPPSAKYLLKILQYEGPMTQKELIKQSMLPERTVRNALNILLKKGLVVKRISVRDARQDLYKIAKRIRF